MTADTNEPDTVDLLGMTKAQLLDEAAQQGIGGVSGRMNKADIIATIEG